VTVTGLVRRITKQTVSRKEAEGVSGQVWSLNYAAALLLRRTRRDRSSSTPGVPVRVNGVSKTAHRHHICPQPARCPSLVSPQSATAQRPRLLFALCFTGNDSSTVGMNSSTVGILIVGVGVAAKVIWELYLSPLARQRIPGPKRAAVSEIWHTWVQIRGYRTFTFHELFEVSVFRSCRDDIYSGVLQRYGPVVRLGPNRVAFRNIDVVKTIYTTHDFRKSSWWNILTFGGSQNMFSTQYGGPVHLNSSFLIDTPFGFGLQRSRLSCALAPPQCSCVPW